MQLFRKDDIFRTFFKNMFFLYWYFLDKERKFQQDAFNGCYNVLLMSMNLSDTAILKIHGFGHRCIISAISRSETINLMQNIGLPERSGTMSEKIITFYDTEIEKRKEDVDTDKALVST